MKENWKEVCNTLGAKKRGTSKS